jgi:hypothetical protein
VRVRVCPRVCAMVTAAELVPQVMANDSRSSSHAGQGGSCLWRLLGFPSFHVSNQATSSIPREGWTSLKHDGSRESPRAEGAWLDRVARVIMKMDEEKQ